MLTNKKIVQKLYNVLQQNGFIGAVIEDVYAEPKLIQITIKIPVKRDLNDLISLLPNISQEFNAHDYKITNKQGKRITILFGKRDLSNVQYKKALTNRGTLKITLPTAYDVHYLDFMDGASTHCLIGGATRMGKTRALLYLITQLTIQTDNHLTVYINSPKQKDFYPFRGIHNIANSISAMDHALTECIDEYRKRDQLLNSKKLRKATDTKDILKYYPEYYKYFRPIFIIIDEYNRFGKDKDIEAKVMELSETAGYVNIHLIIATQRPDARQVIHPNIKSNLLVRIAFTTSTAGNSMVILDHEGAEQLGGKPGRALLLDGDLQIIQFPDLNQEQIEYLIQSYKRNDTDEQDKTGSVDSTLTNQIQSMFTQSDSPLNLP